MENRINIPNDIEVGSDSFSLIQLQITFNNKQATQNYYLHKCLQKEFVETTDLLETIGQSKRQPQTIYFYNEEKNSEVLQLDARREEIDNEASAIEEGTLYFINKEESEP